MQTDVSALQHGQAKIAHFRSEAGILEIEEPLASRLANYFLGSARKGDWWIRPVAPIKDTILLD